MNESIENQKFTEYLEKAKAMYHKQSEMICPYFNSPVTLNSEGFNHLQYKPNRMPRTINEQTLKLMLLRKALKIIPKCGTLQEYRKVMEKIGKKDKSGFYKTKTVQYWGFHAILEDKSHKIKIIIKQIGDGKIIFWSVMPFNQRLYSEGIDIN